MNSLVKDNLLEIIKHLDNYDYKNIQLTSKRFNILSEPELLERKYRYITLEKVCKNGDLFGIEYLLKHRFNPNKLFGTSNAGIYLYILDKCIKYKQLELIKLFSDILNKSNISVSLMNMYTRSRSEDVDKSKNLEIAKFFIEKYFTNLTLSDLKNMSCYYVEHGDFETVKYLMEKILQLDAHGLDTDDGCVIYSIRYGFFEIFKYLFDNFNIRNDAHGLLYESVRKNRTDIFKFLIDNGVEYADRYKTILTICLGRRNIECVKYLVNHYFEKDMFQNNEDANYLALLEYLDSIGYNLLVHANSLLQWSAKYGDLETMKYLIEKGADIYAEDNSVLFWSVRKGHVHIFKYLIEKGMDIHWKNGKLLRLGAKKGHIDLVKYLVNQGVNYNGKDHKALRMSVAGKHMDVIKYLVEHYIANHDYNGIYKAIIVCAKNGYVDIMKYLLSVKNDEMLHIDDEILYTAIIYGHLDVIKFLMNNGAKICMKRDYLSIIPKTSSDINEYLMRN